MNKDRTSNWLLFFFGLFSWAVLATTGAEAQVPQRATAQHSSKDPQSYPADVRQPTQDEQSRELFLLRMAENSARAKNIAGADQYWHDAISLSEATWGPSHPFTAALLSRYAGSLDDQERYVEAEPLYRRALAIRRARLDPDDSSTAKVLALLANNLNLQGRIVEAEPFYREALSIKDRPNGNQAELAVTLNNLGKDLNDQGLSDEADSRRLEAQGKLENAQALKKEAQRHLREAESLLTRALSITESTSGKNSLDTAMSLENLAANLESQGRNTEAQPLYARARAIKSSQSDAAPPPAASYSTEAVSNGERNTSSSIPPDIRVWTSEEQGEVEVSMLTVREYERNGDYRPAESFLRQNAEGQIQRNIRSSQPKSCRSSKERSGMCVVSTRSAKRLTQWKSKYAGMEAADTRRLREVQEKHRH